MELLLVVLVSLVILFLMMLAAIWGMNKATESLVGQKHRLIEEIVSTGGVPQKWARHHRARIAKLQQDSKKSSRLLRLQSQAKSTYLRKLDQLVRYAEQSSLVADEETRTLLLERLAAVRTTWVEREPSEF